MAPQLLLLLGLASMSILAGARVVRVRAGRTPLPDVGGRLPFIVAFVVGPPVVIGAVSQGGLAGGVISVPAYALILAALAFAMWLLALVIERVAAGRSRRILLLALVGSEGDDDITFDPPVTESLAESMAVVETANAAFPRGPEFPTQIGRPDFRVVWNALDAATGTLESRIAEDRRLGLGVASIASALAADARSRLETLRRLALEGGQAWT